MARKNVVPNHGHPNYEGNSKGAPEPKYRIPTPPPKHPSSNDGK